MPIEYTDESVRSDLEMHGFTGPDEPIEVARMRLSDYYEFHWHDPLGGWEVRTGKPWNEMPRADAVALLRAHPWLRGNPGLRSRLPVWGTADPSEAISPPPALSERRWTAPDQLEEALRAEGRWRSVPSALGPRRSGNTTTACREIAKLVASGETDVVVKLLRIDWARHVEPLLLDALGILGDVKREGRHAFAVSGCRVRVVGSASRSWMVGFRGVVVEVTG